MFWDPDKRLRRKVYDETGVEDLVRALAVTVVTRCLTASAAA